MKKALITLLANILQNSDVSYLVYFRFLTIKSLFYWGSSSMTAMERVSKCDLEFSIKINP